jgi:hypothetical protein
MQCFFFLVVLLDYEYALWGLPEGSVERAKVKHEVHLRSARRLQELCFRNGGLYIKLGQHIGQLVCSQSANASFGIYDKNWTWSCLYTVRVGIGFL